MNRVILFVLLITLSGITYPQAKWSTVSHYIFPEFTRGVILLKNGQTHEALLNYNALTEEMVFVNRGQNMSLDDETIEQIDTVFIENRKFFRINGHFVELLYQGPAELFAEHKCRVTMKSQGKPAAFGGTSQTSSTTSYIPLNSEGIYYELVLPDEYETRPYIHYWLRRDGEPIRFTNMRQLQRLYRDKRSTFNDFVKDHELSLEDPNTIRRLIEHMEYP